MALYSAWPDVPLPGSFGKGAVELLLLLLLLRQVHYIMDEMLLNGCIVDTNKQNILEPVQLLENVSS
jgi:AP-4 complex subunit sigma-1